MAITLPVNTDAAHALVGFAEALGSHAVGWFAVGLALTCGSATLLWWLCHRGTHVWRARIEAGDVPYRLVPILVVSFVAVATIGIAMFTAIGRRLVPNHPMVLADHALADAIGAHAAPATLQWFALLTHAGDPIVLTAIGVIVFVVLWRRGRRALAATWALALAGNALLNPLLKLAFERARPPAEGVFATASGFSFPSGHTSGAMVAYGMLGYLALRVLPPRWQCATLILSAAVVFTTACSRVMLRVHFASDVIAGLASGGVWLMACIAAAEAVRHYRSWTAPQGRS